MTTMAMRRTVSSSSPTRPRAANASPRLRISGTTMSFDTMIESATVSTITIAVAADRPPMNAASASTFGTARNRQHQHEHVAVDLAAAECEETGHGDREHEQIDQHEIDRKHPRCAADFRFVVVFDDGHVELTRQQNDCEERQQRHDQEGARLHPLGDDIRKRRLLEAPT